MENKEESIRDDNPNVNDECKPLIQPEEEQIRLEDEEFRDEFKCCICLDLLYKPVVLACGHMSCFWCVFNAMNSWHESHCPLCRHPYNHFPSVCQLLHFLLLKLYPVASKAREGQVREVENEVGHSSPQFDQHLFGSHPRDELNILATGQGELSLTGKSLNGTLDHHRDSGSVESATTSKSAQTDAIEARENIILRGDDCERTAQKQVSAADLTCAACKKLLFRPVVLNCGHVYCQSCIVVPENGIHRCQICQSLHPNGLPSVCLILDQLLEENFSDVYTERREALLKQTDCLNIAQQHATGSSSLPPNVYTSWLFGSGPKVHVGFGCDSCGMSPIIGERYRCKDCTEKIGFDLCEGCYQTPTIALGRFNQQHKPEHVFEVVEPGSIIEVIRMMNAEQSDDDAGLYSPDYLDDVFGVQSGDGPQDSEIDSGVAQDVSPAFILSVDLAMDTDDDDSE